MVAQTDKDGLVAVRGHGEEENQVQQDDGIVEGSESLEADSETNNEAQFNTQTQSSDLVDADFDIDDNCEMVMSFKCRHCSFLAQDKATLSSHIRHRHVSGGGGGNGKRHRHKSNNHHNQNPGAVGQQVEDHVDNVEFDVSKIKMNKREIGKEEFPPIPSIPPTPDAFFINSDEEDDDSCQLLPSNDEGFDVMEDRDPLEMDDVFLCAECDIVFASKELCCRHMHDIHGLEQFSAEFIQEVIISKRPGEDDTNAVDEDKADNGDSNNSTNSNSMKTDKRNMRKRIKPPKHYTLEEGALVPKKYRVSKSLTFFCSKCLIKYESEEMMKLHENCHIGPQDTLPKDGKSWTNQLNKSGEEKSRSEDEDSCGEELDPSLEGQRKTFKNGGETEYKFKCPICPSVDAKPDRNRSMTEAEKSTDKKLSRFFTKWSNCSGHLWREHQVDCELYSCTVCKKFKNYYITKVKDHERLHKPEANYTCNICNKKFKQRHQLTTHQKYHKEKATRLPPPSESRWYTPKECHICKRVLSDAKCLKKHISAVHNKLKPYCCNICGHMTARKAELRLHIRQHTGEKPFKCTHCPFATGDHNSLRKHKLRHGNQRPYSCPCCDYRCIQSSAFKKHMVSIHPDQDVVFQCHLCPHASVNETVASSHLKDHEEGRIASTSRCHSQNEDSTERSGGQSSPAHSNENDNSNSSSSSNDYPEIGIRCFGRRPPVRKPKSPQKPRWLEEDSVDVIDTGGVTIPASPTPINIVENSHSREAAELDPSSACISKSSEDQEPKELAGKPNPNAPLSDDVNQPQVLLPSRNRMEDLTTVNLDDIT